MPKLTTLSQLDAKIADIEAELAAVQLKRRERVDAEKKDAAEAEKTRIKVASKVLFTFVGQLDELAPEIAQAFRKHLDHWVKRPNERAALGFPPRADA